MFPELGAAHADQAYGQLVNAVLPVGLVGFFAAAMLGAILSSYNSALNSTCTLFSLCLYQGMLAPQASEREAVFAGKLFGWAISVFSMATAPLLIGQESIFGYLQQMNGIYFVPILAVVLCAMLSPRMPPLAAKTGLILGPLLVASGYFVAPVRAMLSEVHEYHFLGLVFLILIGVMLVIQRLAPREQPRKDIESDVVDMTPWPLARAAGVGLCAMVLALYVSFFNFH